MSKKINKIATHSGHFHADDLFAVATLQRLYPEAVVIRTRDEEEFSKCDIRVDIGRKYNPETLDFDHHQDEELLRENKIPYASFGLVWKHYGEEVCGSKEVAEKLEKSLVVQVDAPDNGFDLCKRTTEFIPYNLSAVIGAINPAWNESLSKNQQFDEGLKFASYLLDRSIIHAKALVEAEKNVGNAIEISEHKNVLVLDRYWPWQQVVLESKKSKDFLYVVLLNDDGLWYIYTIPKELRSFENRKTLPSAWCGLMGEPLIEACGVEGAVFCHKRGFIAANETKKGAIKMAELASEL